MACFSQRGLFVIGVLQREPIWRNLSTIAEEE